MAMSNEQVCEALAELAHRWRYDPLAFVRGAFPWGVGTLLGWSGPDKWQEEQLRFMGEQLKSGVAREEVVRMATASGHGIGKSCQVAWVILWAICTGVDTRGVVTANTDTQLRTKTWAELAKWYHRCIFKPVFELTATSIFSKTPGHDKTWRIDAIPWSESNPEAFAGLHNQGKRLLIIFDEASAIADMIWEVIEGALTDKDTEIFWVCYGNPTRGNGRFYDCFNRYKARWKTWQIDSRNVAVSNKTQIAQWLEDYGEDSDFFKIRVRGVFPSASVSQFISSAVVDMAMQREAPAYNSMLQKVAIVGVDVARFGDDSSVICVRSGLDARTDFIKLTNVDGFELGMRVGETIDRLYNLFNFQKVYCFVDEGGVGSSPLDWLRHHGYDVQGVNFGSRADDDRKYANKRAEMWGRMRDWLQDGAIPDDEGLKAALTSPEYTITPKEQILLEKKADMKKRGLASPDEADALAVTFAYNVHIPLVDDRYAPSQSKAEASRQSYRWSGSQSRTNRRW